MTCKHLYRSPLLAAVLLVAVSAGAMPPAPELLTKIHDRQIDTPYFLQHEHDLRAAGIETPAAARSLQDYMSGTLDTDFRAIALLVDFSDHTSSVAASSFDGLLYGTGANSLRSYYSEVTYGNLTIATVNLPSSLGWDRAPQTYAYYVNGQNGTGAYPRNAQKLTEDVIALANPYVDFSQYDNDGDGYVDALFIIHSGTGAEVSGNNNDIWSHQWATSQPQLVDGVRCYVYSIEPEYWTSPGDMTCGVYAHEMGHAAFGLPDLYDYGYDSKGLGRWSLMAGGSWNGTRGNSPAHPDAWCRIHMGAATPTNVTANLPAASIPAVETNASIFRLWTSGQPGNEYFLVENRRQTGFDAALPGQGLLVYHIDDSRSNNDNQWYPGMSPTSHYHVAVEQADGLWEMEHNADAGDAADPFPGSGNHPNFNDTSTPNSRSYAGAATNVAVLNVSASAPTMTADLMVGSGGTPTPSLTVSSPNGGESWIVGNTAAITWSASNFSDNVNVQLNRSYPGGTWETLGTVTATSGSYSWTVNGTATTGARIRVRGAATTTVGDTSNANFTISGATPAGSLTLNSPNGGESWVVGSTAYITWTSSNFNENLRIDLNRNYPGGVWEGLASSTANDGSFDWVVAGAASSSARIRIYGAGTTTIGDTSNANFTINGGVTNRSLTVTAPNGGETWVVGSTAAVTWTSSNLTGYVRVELNRNYPAGSWETLASYTGNDGSQNFYVSGAASTNARIRVRSTSYTTVGDTSDANFTISGGTNTRSIALTAPNGGETWTIGSPATVTWTSSNLSGYVRVELNRNYPGGTWETLASYTTNDGSQSFTISGAASTSARVRVRSTSYSSVADTSNANFTISGGNGGGGGIISVVSPNGGETLARYSSTILRWSSSNVSGYVRIQLNRNYPGGTWETITSLTTNDGVYTWPVSGALTSAARLRVLSYSNAAVGDTSDANFSIAVSGTPALDAALPLETKLDGAYPNPFNPVTTIRYQLSEAGHVRLTVYNMEGREVAVLVDGDEMAGRHAVPFDGSRLSTGTYVLRLTAGAHTSVQRMLLLK